MKIILSFVLFSLLVAHTLGLTRVYNAKEATMNKAQRIAVPPHLDYHNNIVMTAPKVYFIYVGEDSRGSYQTTLNGLVNDMSGSPFLALLAEYTGTNGAIPGTVTLAGSTYQAMKLNTQTTLTGLANNLAGWFDVNGGTIPYDANTLYYFIMSPDLSVSDAGGSCVAWCGIHTYDFLNNGNTFYYAVNADCPRVCTFPGSLGTAASDQTKVASHEMIEWMTDPQISTWLDDKTGMEIADICNDYASNAVWNGNTYSVNPVWSNHYGQCIIYPGSTPTPVHCNKTNHACGETCCADGWGCCSSATSTCGPGCPGVSLTYNPILLVALLSIYLVKWLF